MLLYTLYDDRVRTDGRKVTGSASEMECKTEKQLIKRLFEVDDFVRTAQCIVDWLEDASAEKLDEFYNKIQYFIDNAGQAGENTLFALKRGKYSGIVQHMDPDACNRENQKLTSLDEEDEERLLRHIWACIRAGNWFSYEGNSIFFTKIFYKFLFKISGLTIFRSIRGS